MRPENPTHAVAVVDGLLDQPAARDLVAAYFAADLGFAGTLFDTVGRQVPDEITTDDLLAITLLDVSCSPTAVRKLLADRADDIAVLLRQVPVDLGLWELSRADIDDRDKPMNRLWTTLRDNGVGRVTTSKLLARKRPHLVPIGDSVIRAQLGLRNRYWWVFHHLLSDATRRSRIDALQPEATPRVATLRLLDVLLWMSASEARGARTARFRTGFSAPGRELLPT